MPMLEPTERIQEGGATTPDELAAEFLALRGAGETPDEAVFLARLPDEAAREEFRSLVEAVGVAERGLPRTIVGGFLLAGRYRILERLGGGGMSVVYSALDEQLGRKVAVKFLDPLAHGNQEREELFRKESRILAEMRHPGIVAVHDAGRDGDHTFIVMDLVEGLSLADVLDRARSVLVLDTRGDRLPARDGAMLSRALGRKPAAGRTDLVDPKSWYRSCARILLEITRTIEAAHGKKVVHRDLKPANVMLVGGGNPVVLDFGLAGSPDHAMGGVTESLYGSVCYLAPEQARSNRVGMDPRTDVYQLGLILYEMLTLRRAFPGNAIGEVLRRIESGWFLAPRKVDPRVPRDLEAICTRALELSPWNRYAGAKDLREDLERWLEGRVPQAARSARWRSLVRTSRYTARQHPVMSAAAAIALVGLGVAAWAWGRGVDPMIAISPFRYDPATSAITLLPESGDGIIHPSEWLGAEVESRQEVFVWTLSTFGAAGEEQRVRPIRPFFPGDQQASPKEPWGLRVQPRTESGGRKVVAAMVTSDAPEGSSEGLIVLASTVDRPEIEGWMTDLDSDSEGMLYSQVQEILATHVDPPIVRGEIPKRSFTDVEREGFRRDFAESPPNEPRPTLGLPGVEERRVECLVARPQTQPK